MRKLITSFIGPNVAQPIKQGTLDHLQLAYQEAINALGRMGIGQDYDPTKVYVLYGCENTNTAPNYDINAGAIFYGGEIYLLDAVSFVAADTAVGTITTSYFASAIADPVTFTDGVAHNVHEIKKMVVADAVSGSGTADYDDWVKIIEDWRLVGTAGNPSFMGTWSNSGLFPYPMKFRMNKRDRTVTVSGSVNGDTDATLASNYIFTLPSEYWPSINRGFIMSDYGGNFYICTIRASDGVVVSGGPLSAPATDFLIPEFTYYLD